MTIAYISQSSLVLLEKVDEKNPPDLLFYHTLIFKTAYIFPPIVLLLSAIKNSSLHDFSCKQEAKSLCAY